MTNADDIDSSIVILVVEWLIDDGSGGLGGRGTLTVDEQAT